MTTKESSPHTADTAEKTRKLIRELVETPPAKTMADVKAACDVYEANAREQGSEQTEETRKPQPDR